MFQAPSIKLHGVHLHLFIFEWNISFFFLLIFHFQSQMICFHVNKQCLFYWKALDWVQSGLVINLLSIEIKKSNSNCSYPTDTRYNLSLSRSLVVLDRNIHNGFICLLILLVKRMRAYKNAGPLHDENFRELLNNWIVSLFFFQMALEGKVIKEEILDKDLYEVNLIRAKGELILQKK